MFKDFDCVRFPICSYSAFTLQEAIDAMVIDNEFNLLHFGFIIQQDDYFYCNVIVEKNPDVIDSFLVQNKHMFTNDFNRVMDGSEDFEQEDVYILDSDDPIYEVVQKLRKINKIVDV